MQLTEILSRDCVKHAVPCSSKKRALEIISEIAADRLGRDPQDIFESLLMRERMGSTGLGQGIAMPHGRLTGEAEPIAILLQCEEPIGFESLDNQPVDLLVGLLVPEAECQQHLKTLSAFAAKLNDKQLCRKLRAANSDSELYQLFTEQSEIS